MKRSNFTMSKDGEKRVNVVVKYRLTMDELAVMITSNLGYALDSGCDVNKLIPGKRKAINIAKDETLGSGIETPHYRVGDNKWEAYKDQVLVRLEELWNE